MATLIPTPTTASPSCLQGSVDPRRSVNLPTSLVLLTDQLRQPSVLPTAPRLWTSKPGIETATGDLQGPTHQAHLEGLPVVTNEAEPQLCSFAK